MAPKTDSFGGAPHIPVDSFIEHEMGLRPQGYKNSYHFHVEESEQHAGSPVYMAKKVRADKKAIANLDALPPPQEAAGANMIKHGLWIIALILIAGVLYRLVDGPHVGDKA